MKYSVVTFGCRVNQADSLALEAECATRGLVPSASDQADLVIVNTCSVTASADQGARQTMRRIARENPGARIVATGCYATRCAAEVSSLPGVLAVIPNAAKQPATFFGSLERALNLPSLAQLAHCGHPEPGFAGRTAWTLGAQTGCEQACSYCIIPSTRGVSRSREIDALRHDMRRAIDAGFKEIVLTGVHLGSFGRDLSPSTTLAALLRVLIDEIEVSGQRVLLRVSSLEPMDVPDALVDLPLAPHFHLPLQHASNRILSAMRRPYTLDYFAALVDRIRRRLPHAAIGSDVLVGFPGETDVDFERLTTYLDHSPLTHLHVFPYSERPGTDAAMLPDKVHGVVIKERAQRVREISRRLHTRFRASLSGMVRPALTIDDGSVAVTDNYVRVPAPAGHARNEWVEVTL